MSILERINSSNDIKKLPEEELEPLCQELRDYMISSISRTGGHLASNLGAVELTVALHRVYDTSRDRVVFDVGHQSYVHKIITGRRDSFCTLRQHGGLSGFPKPYESEDDAFIAGHASNSVSVALGMARARTLSHADYDVAAIIGDGALSGGLAYEGLANAAASGEPLVVILNDNNMSINENVGGTAHLLESLRVRPGYISFKRWYRDVFTKLPGLYKFNHAIKEWLKKRLLPGNVFSGMGMYYLGPVDGHDIGKLETVIRWARELRKPVLVHVVTKKGKGYKYAEEHPEKFHGVGRFDIETGELHDSGDCFSAKMGESLSRLADNDGRIIGITAAMSSGTGMDVFSAAHPDRFFDVGIAEGHAVSMAGGMAKQGMVPVFAVYSSFLQRGYDMLIHDVALQNLHVVFCVDRAGLVGSDGETHHGVFDVSYLSSVPDMTVLCPASYAELETMLRAAIYDINGSVAIRYPRGGEGKYTACNTAPETLLREGRDVTLVCYGIMTNEVLDAAERLAAEGICAEVIKLSMIKPPDFDLVMRSLRKTGKLLISEDVCEAGCVGSRILEEAAINEIHVRAAKLLNLGEGIVPHGTVAELLHDFGLDADGIVSAAMEMMDKDMK
ncbi:MAG: 1-deoxy-D-xylulose-5-phosphate synthase [Oscillospiraceae bacterium]